MSPQGKEKQPMLKQVWFYLFIYFWYNSALWQSLFSGDGGNTHTHTHTHTHTQDLSDIFS